MSASSYRPGLIGEVVRLHAEYYARNWSFGLAFEAKVAIELSRFLIDFREGADFMAVRYSDEGNLLATISLEAPRHDEPMAHLRWFITSQDARGTGLGRGLLEAALAHADEQGFSDTYLTTFEGLAAARALYERCGFRLAGEAAVDQWSGGVREQRFERRHPRHQE